MDSLGVAMHVVTQETENDQGLDGGQLGRHRKLYYRELVARFAHHLAVQWNLGEENTNTSNQRQDFATFIRGLDPYDHPIVCHTYPGKYDGVYRPLLGAAEFEGPSLQMGDMKATHAETIKWIDRSAEGGRPWFVCLDEIGPAEQGAKPDADDSNHDDVRRWGLWGNLMAGGSGCEWYFGYKFAHNDLNCEDFRSRSELWRQSRLAAEFFREYLPFQDMRHADELLAGNKDAWCLAKPGEVYAVYMPKGGKLKLDVAEGRYRVHWFNPQKGGKLQVGSVSEIAGPGRQSLGIVAGASKGGDWVVLIRGIK
jgi:hypothetical protein